MRYCSRVNQSQCHDQGLLGDEKMNGELGMIVKNEVEIPSEDIHADIWLATVVSGEYTVERS